VHPLLRTLLAEEASAGASLYDYRVPIAVLDDELKQDSLRPYHDPFGNHPAGAAWNKEWLAAAAPVAMPAAEPPAPPSSGDEVPPDPASAPAARDADAPLHESTSGLVVLVQEDLAAVTAPVRDLASILLREAALAMTLVGIATPLWWFLVSRFTSTRERRVAEPERGS